jgi:alpha-tubulin suppressor-like RCC1 family protein
MRLLRRAVVVLGVALVACNAIVGFDELSKVDRVVADDGGGGGDGAPVEDVLLGARHTCAIMVDRTLRCWGLNDFGQLGLGDTQNRLVPTIVKGMTKVTFVSLGERHTCATLEGGAVHCWGSNESGQLGTGPPDTKAHPNPTKVEAAPAKKIQAGKAHTCTETLTKTVECWGANAAGQLGDGTLAPKSSPTRVPALAGVEKLSTGGGDHSCAVAQGDGGGDSVYCWGLNDKGQLGQPSSVASSPSPLIVPNVVGADKVFVGKEHSCAVLGDTTVQCWGSNERGQLGDGTFGTRPTPAPVMGVIGLSEVAAGFGHGCGAEKTAQIVKCWGQNQYGELGLGTAGGNRAAPERIQLDGWESVSAKGNHTCGKRKGIVHCWGRNDSGQLGIGVLGDVATPTPIKI